MWTRSPSTSRPGRLLVVDLRDPLIAQDEALALFMVLLRTFGQVEGPEIDR